MSIVMDPYVPDRFSISLTQRPQWQALQQHAAQQQWRHLRELFAADLGSVLDLDAIRSASIRMGVDPLGGAGVHYWAAIAERYRLNLTVLSEDVNPTFAFMTLDWDGKIRMDPSSSFAMQRLIGLKDRFDVAFACDTDYDRHGIVTRGAGRLQVVFRRPVRRITRFRWRGKRRRVLQPHRWNCVDDGQGRHRAGVAVGVLQPSEICGAVYRDFPPEKVAQQLQQRDERENEDCQRGEGFHSDLDLAL
jgi:hypothetical protein